MKKRNRSAEEPKNLERERPCKDCPFIHYVPMAAMEPGVGPQPEMLCHESLSLKGVKQDGDYVCRGWQNNNDG